MKEELKAAWVSALRSGRYKQAREYLRTRELGDDGEERSSSFCCLGVLCDLLEPDGWEQQNGNCYVHDLQAGEAEHIDSKVCEDEGLNLRTTIALAQLNDSGASFEEIAKVIEKIDLAREYDLKQLKEAKGRANNAS